MARTIMFPRKRRRILITAAGRVIPGVFILGLVVPTLIFARRGPESITIPAGTTFIVETVSEVSSRMPIGARIETRLKNDLYVHGHLVSPAGTAVYGVVTHSEGGKPFGKQQLATTLNALHWNGQLYTLVSDTAVVVAKPGGGRIRVVPAGEELEIHLRRSVHLP